MVSNPAASTASCVPPAQPDLHQLSIEYATALAEVAYLLPQYKAAVARYTAARQAMKNFIAEQDNQLNIL